MKIPVPVLQQEGVFLVDGNGPTFHVSCQQLVQVGTLMNTSNVLLTTWRWRAVQLAPHDSQHTFLL
jgi:hypothetical protein